MPAPARDTPVLVSASLQPRAREAAPLLETRPQAPPPRRALQVAVGQQAAPSFDAAAEQAFSAAAAPADVVFTACPDREACELLLVGRADLAVIAGTLSPREQGAGLWQTRLGVELWALVVPPQSPVLSLTRAQVRQILTGQATSWSQVGFEGSTIVVVVPADAAAAERAARALIPGDEFAAGAVRVQSERHVADQLLQQAGAIGIVCIADAPLESGMKTLQIDWCAPTPDAFAYGTYTAGLPVHLVTAGPPAAEAQRFVEFARSPEGRTLLGRRLAVQ